MCEKAVFALFYCHHGCLDTGCRKGSTNRKNGSQFDKSIKDTLKRADEKMYEKKTN